MQYCNNSFDIFRQLNKIKDQILIYLSYFRNQLRRMRLILNYQHTSLTLDFNFHLIQFLCFSQMPFLIFSLANLWNIKCWRGENWEQQLPNTCFIWSETMNYAIMSSHHLPDKHKAKDNHKVCFISLKNARNRDILKRQTNWNMKLHSGDSVNKDNFLLTGLCTLSQHYLIIMGNYKLWYSPKINLWVHFAIYDAQLTKGSFRHFITTDKKELLLIQRQNTACLCGPVKNECSLIFHPFIGVYIWIHTD